jgi:hypothetical protein
MNKDRLEEIFRKGGAKPVSRQKLEDFDLYIGDGFSLSPHTHYRRFGVEATDFPRGMYVTWWWIGKDENLFTGQPLFCDVNHDPEYSWDDKKQMRVRSAIETAKGFLKTWNKNVTKH